MLNQEDIKNGTIIWYGGSTSLWGWDCPAVIENVDQDMKTFQVRSLDDGAIQKQVYAFEVNENSPESRKSMRVPSKEECDNFIKSNLSSLLSERDRLVIETEALSKKIENVLLVYRSLGFEESC